MEYTMKLTEEQMMIIRHALCDKSLKLLSKAFETEDELKKLNRASEEVWEYQQHDKVNEIINMIDVIRA